jgi:hypothetical protein
MTHDETTRTDTGWRNGNNDDGQLDELIADYLQQLDQGTAPTRDEFIAAILTSSTDCVSSSLTSSILTPVRRWSTRHRTMTQS